MNGKAEIRPRIVAAIDKVLVDSGRDTRAYADQARLKEDLGLDSLDLAGVVVQLEETLGVDPFRANLPAIRTLEDLVRVYHDALEA